MADLRSTRRGKKISRALGAPSHRRNASATHTRGAQAHGKHSQRAGWVGLQGDDSIQTWAEGRTVAEAPWQHTRLEAAALACQRVAQLAQMVLRAAALVLVHEQHHGAALAGAHTLIVEEWRGVGGLAARAQLHRLGTAGIGQAVRQPRRAQLLALHLLHQQQATERRQLLGGGAAG